MATGSDGSFLLELERSTYRINVNAVLMWIAAVLALSAVSAFFYAALYL